MTALDIIELLQALPPDTAATSSTFDSVMHGFKDAEISEARFYIRGTAALALLNDYDDREDKEQG